ncbi:MAG TPA: amidohydrolase family protein [Candidatus Acidoferrum sp.]|nr:amidohydrolase family protein [Candidatus Acidoferrum sp.]
MPAIHDVHAHLTPLSVLARLEQEGIGKRDDGAGRIALPTAVSGFPAAVPLPISALHHDLAERRRWMDERGIARQYLSVPPYFFAYGETPRRGAELARLANDDLAAARAAAPEAFGALAAVPLQDVPLAIAELEHAMARGFAGAAIGSNIAGVELDDARFEPFWEACVALGALIFIHPHHQAGAERMQDYYLHNCVGNPTETGLAAARLIFGGVLERHPLSIVLSHGGGVLPQIVGRLDHAYAVRTESRTTPLPPSDYARRFFYDTIAHDTLALRSLLERVGAEQIVVGTDAPFDMGSDAPAAVLDALQLDAAARLAIESGNVQRLLGRTATLR